MENYIFIIIAIVLSVIGAIGKKNKRAQEANSASTRKPNLFDSYFEEMGLTNEKKTSAYATQPSSEVKKERQNKRTPMTRKPFFSNESDELRIKKTPDLISKVEKVKDEIRSDQPRKNKSKILTDFSLKNAVIYSEILERKY